VVENSLHAGPTPLRSTSMGLINMRERFRIATNRVVVWGAERDRFVVRLPLVSSPDLDPGHAKSMEGG
jgi:hypothetical protein